MPRTVVFCCDADGDVSPNLNTRAWKRFGRDLANLKLPVVDLIADADIEDVTLVGIQGMRRFLGLPDNAEPKGRKGKTRLGSLYKAVDVTRPHEAGERAHHLICCLSIKAIEEGVLMNMKALRQVVFGTD